MDSETQQLNLFKVRGVRHPEYWQCIEYVAPSNEKKEWKASEAEAVFCKECKTTIPYHSSKNSKGVTRHMNKFHEDLLQNFRRKRNNAGEVKIDTGEKLTVLQSKAFDGLFTKIRDQETTPLDFKRYSDRLMNILAEECLGDIGSSPVEVKTPTGATYMGTLPSTDICVVSIVRAGDSLLNAVLRCEPSLPVGKILIQRDESTEAKTPRMYYSKLPPRIASMNVLLVDPMLATGGSAKMAIKTLIDAGVEEEKITFLNVIACPEGLEAVFLEYPAISIVTAAVDERLTGEKYIWPGLGDYGDRYFNTVPMN